ncbi:MAG TPA: hypothetical protein VKF84_12940 [Candidatus Sulfotelmatobacter sp.]|nr:hypothetical protein [Candidatus Sulfotelmatobacter sp.]
MDRGEKEQTAKPAVEWFTSVMELARTEDRSWPVMLVFKAAALAALLATVVSALAIALFSAFATRGGDSSLGAWDIAKSSLLLCSITAVSCGSFGFLAGLAGGTVLYARRRRIRSIKRFLIESALAGMVLGCMFPVFDAAVNSPSFGSFRLWLNPAQIVFCVPAGITCALICALAFRRRVIQ